MRFILILLSLGVFIGCTGQPKKKTDHSSWAHKMNKTADSFRELFPYIYNEEKFENKKEKAVIAKKIQNFHDNIHSISPKQAKALLGDDPYLTSSIASLQEMTTRSKHSFDKGDLETARILLKATTNTCFKCHTRQNLGPQNVVWKNFQLDQLDISALEKAHILVSLRQYDFAKKQLMSFLENKEIDKEFDLFYENALHYYLMISLRAQNDLTPSLKFVRNKINNPIIPTRMHYTLKHWEKDLLYWTKNKNNIRVSLNAAHKALKRNSKSNSERHLINDLMAGIILHQYLMSEKSQIQKAKAYRLLGQVYEELILAGFWDLPEIYFEKCINYAPKSKIAKSCFNKLKDNVVLGYSGSRGTLIPQQEYSRLEKLRIKAGYK